MTASQKTSLPHLTFGIVTSEEGSARLIMDWRNDELTRRQSFHQEHKTWPEFYEEFLAEYIADRTLPCLFAMQEDKKVAFLRFRRIEDPLKQGRRACDISINVAPAERGRGVGSAAVSGCLPLLRQWGVETVLAEVKIDNERSVRMFESAGFTYLDRSEHLIPDTAQKVLVHRLIADLSGETSSAGSAITRTQAS